MLIFLGVFVHAQVEPEKQLPKDTLVIDSGKKDSLKVFKPTTQDYLYQTQFSEKKIFDTTFTIQRSYSATQYNHRDNFGKIQFANIGAGFQPLVYEADSEKNLAVLPTTKSFNIVGIKDVQYYDVKTPTTIFHFNNAMKNGGELHTTYTQNVGKRFNFAIDYLGLRSLGAYTNSLSANNNTLFSGHYQSKNNRYKAFAHYLHQNVNDQEYGGIANLDYFLNGAAEFKTRTNLQINLTNSNTQFSYRRYYLSQQLVPFNSEKYPFIIRHTIYNQTNKYYFTTVPESYYGNSSADLVANYPYTSKKYSNNFSNTLSLLFDRKNFKIDAGLRYQIIKLGVGEPLQINNISIPAEISENRIGAVANLQMQVQKKMALNSNFEYSNGKAFGNFIKSENTVEIEPIKDYLLNAHLNFQTSAPSFNFLMNTSVYNKFNYYFSDFKNETVTKLGGNISLKKWDVLAKINLYKIDNYAYFDATGLPHQSDSSLNISQIGAENTFKYKKFNLNSTLQLQSALSNKDLLPMPNFIGRLNFFYQAKAFKNAAEIQTGIKVYYFSNFASRDYLPVLNEFVSPNSKAYNIGGQPIVDAFFNMKAKRMYLYAEAQHLNTILFKNQSYTAPYFPISDFRLNLGIIWYLFS